MLATNFGSPLHMVTKVGSQILATKFGFVPDWSIVQMNYKKHLPELMYHSHATATHVEMRNTCTQTHMAQLNLGLVK